MGPHVRSTKLLVRVAALEKKRLIFKDRLNISTLFILASFFFMFTKVITAVCSLHMALHTNTDSVIFGLCTPIKIILLITLVNFFCLQCNNLGTNSKEMFCSVSSLSIF